MLPFSVNPGYTDVSFLGAQVALMSCIPQMYVYRDQNLAINWLCNKPEGLSTNFSFNLSISHDILWSNFRIHARPESLQPMRIME